METPGTPDTIDLSKTFVRLIRLVTENTKAIAFTVILCLSGGVGYFLLVPRIFESKMIIQSDILSESYALKLAENLNTHIRDHDIEFLSSQLNLTEEEAWQLDEFKILSALTPMSQQMAEKDKIIVVISVRVGDNKILPKLQLGIVGYFSNNEYIKKRVDEKRKELESLINAIDGEIKQLDSLKRKIINGTLAGAKIGGVAIMDIGDLYSVAEELYEKKFLYIHTLAVVDSVQIIEDLTPYGKPVWPKLSIVILASLVVAGIILLIFISYRSSSGQTSE